MNSRLMQKHACVIGVDIGGTKIKAGAVEVGAGGVGTRVAHAREVATPRADPAAFYDAVATVIRDVHAQAEHSGLAVLPCVAVAHPGRFLPDGRLARGTTPNLGSAPGQFDGLSPSAELERRLSNNSSEANAAKGSGLGAQGTCPEPRAPSPEPKNQVKWRVFAENDAIAQMRFGLDALLRDEVARPPLLGQTVVYLGPGTGMGGGVARVDAEGAVAIVTDGHLFDLQLPGYGDGTLTAEELFTGPAIARYIREANEHSSSPIEPARAGEVDSLLRSPATPPEQRAFAERIVDVHGEILALLIETIHAGRMTKVRLEPTPDGRLLRHVDEPDRAWSAADCALIRGCARFILGGFVGTSRGFGARMRERALALLRQRGLREVAIFQIPVESADAGLLGVVRALSSHDIERCQTALSKTRCSPTVSRGRLRG